MPPYTWLSSGTLPSWLSLSAGGVLSAVNPPAGTYYLSVYVVDSTGIQTFPQTITLNIQPGTSSIVSQFFPHFADGGIGDTWQTEFLLINETSSTVNAALVFHMDSPATALPIGVPALGNVSQTPSVAIGPNGSMLYRTTGSGSSNLVTGWAEIQSTQPLSGQALFRRHAADGNYYEGSVPLLSSPVTQFEMAFDGTSYTVANGSSVQFVTGLAITNPSSGATAQVTCSAYGSDGTPLAQNLQMPAQALPAFGHTALQLQPSFPALGANRGLLVCQATNPVGVLGLRFFGLYALSSLPITP